MGKMPLRPLEGHGSGPESCCYSDAARLFTWLPAASSSPGTTEALLSCDEAPSGPGAVC